MKTLRSFILIFFFSKNTERDILTTHKEEKWNALAHTDTLIALGLIPEVPVLNYTCMVRIVFLYAHCDQATDAQVCLKLSLGIENNNNYTLKHRTKNTEKKEKSEAKQTNKLI